MEMSGDLKTIDTAHSQREHYPHEGSMELAPKPEPYRSFDAHQQAHQYRWPVGRKRVLGHSHLLGCCVASRDAANSLCVLCILMVVVLIFLISVVPRGEVYSYVIVSVFSFFALVSLAFSVLVDPGILLPLPPDPERQPQIVIVNGKEVLCKVCPTCHIVRPPRSTHCRFCDYCVEEFDHHCGVLGSCVAKRTFRFFAGFFIFTSVLVFYVGIRSVLALVKMDYSANGGEAHWSVAAAIICVAAALLSGCIVAPMAVYYVCLGCLNSTQKETARLGLGVCEPNHDYHEGYCRNFWRRYFGPLGDSRINSQNAESMV
ncbi:DHHC-type zinc finger family protein [Trypanosoma grayi]|uniref:DHHC-type zinc finger family protein n=1 Tax=Trypanosoma grayi TaxID=71804 RepID=UPI0004F43EE8|nr:DHHC-type zinc finger family protein [Trypanosoma grayi]KEG10927.1 DHHC-type zinc finger family protein [Trypanosoma grayi]